MIKDDLLFISNEEDIKEITAAEARKIVCQRTQEAFQNELNHVFVAIHKGINNCDDYVVLDWWISDDTEIYLKRLGYQVTKKTCDKDITTISWKGNI